MFNIQKRNALSIEAEKLVTENSKLHERTQDYIVENRALREEIDKLKKMQKSAKLKETLVDLLLTGCTSNIEIIQKDFSGNIELLTDMQEH